MDDREKLIIVLNNLFENAVKFTREGRTIQMSAKDYSDSIEISIGNGSTFSFKLKKR